MAAQMEHHFPWRTVFSLCSSSLTSSSMRIRNCLIRVQLFFVSFYRPAISFFLYSKPIGNQFYIKKQWSLELSLFLLQPLHAHIGLICMCKCVQECTAEQCAFFAVISCRVSLDFYSSVRSARQAQLRLRSDSQHCAMRGGKKIVFLF